MKIYTKTGDMGETGLLGGNRVPKNDPRIAAVGAVDELNAALGVAICCKLPANFDALLVRLQADLFELGADLATPAALGKEPRIHTTNINAMEKAIDETSATLPPLKSFILPGGSPAAAQLHLARAVCRRAERCVVALADGSSVGEHVLAYLNRLSDLLFVLARAANVADGVEETKWTSS